MVDYDPAWSELFAALGRDLRAALGEVALRIDHVGSTAVPGLAAKPIIDVQISVASFEPLGAFREPIESCGFAFAATTTISPAATSASRPVAAVPMSMCAEPAASPSNSTIAPRLKRSLERTHAEAKHANHRYARSEHLLLAIAASNGVASDILQRHSIDEQTLRDQIADLLPEAAEIAAAIRRGPKRRSRLRRS